MPSEKWSDLIITVIRKGSRWHGLWTCRYRNDRINKREQMSLSLNKKWVVAVAKCRAFSVSSCRLSVFRKKIVATFEGNVACRQNPLEGLTERQRRYKEKKIKPKKAALARIAVSAAHMTHPIHSSDFPLNNFQLHTIAFQKNVTFVCPCFIADSMSKFV